MIRTEASKARPSVTVEMSARQALLTAKVLRWFAIDHPKAITDIRPIVEALNEGILAGHPESIESLVVDRAGWNAADNLIKNFPQV